MLDQLGLHQQALVVAAVVRAVVDRDRTAAQRVVAAGKEGAVEYVLRAGAES